MLEEWPLSWRGQRMRSGRGRLRWYEGGASGWEVRGRGSQPPLWLVHILFFLWGQRVVILLLGPCALHSGVCIFVLCSSLLCCGSLLCPASRFPHRCSFLNGQRQTELANGWCPRGHRFERSRLERAPTAFHARTRPSDLVRRPIRQHPQPSPAPLQPHPSLRVATLVHIVATLYCGTAPSG